MQAQPQERVLPVASSSATKAKTVKSSQAHLEAYGFDLLYFSLFTLQAVERKSNACSPAYEQLGTMPRSGSMFLLSWASKRVT